MSKYLIRIRNGQDLLSLDYCQGLIPHLAIQFTCSDRVFRVWIISGSKDPLEMLAPYYSRGAVWQLYFMQEL